MHSKHTNTRSGLSHNVLHSSSYSYEVRMVRSICSILDNRQNYQNSLSDNDLFTTFGYLVLPSCHTCFSLRKDASWNSLASQLRVLEVAFNDCLRRIWSLPANTYTAILHYCANMLSIYLSSRSNRLLTVWIYSFKLGFLSRLHRIETREGINQNRWIGLNEYSNC